MKRRKIADLTKTLGTVSPDKTAVMFKIAVHNESALHSFLDGSNPVSKPIFGEVLESYEIFDLFFYLPLFKIVKQSLILLQGSHLRRSCSMTKL